jgi:hypothetical protein
VSYARLPRFPVALGVVALLPALLTGTFVQEASAVSVKPVTKDICAAPTPGHMSCLAKRRVDIKVNRSLHPAVTGSAPAGYAPADLRP